MVVLACSPAHPPPCGYCLEASMTATAALPYPSGLRIKSAMTVWSPRVTGRSVG